jgi:VWFA-related protein
MITPDLHARPIQGLSIGDCLNLREREEAVQWDSSKHCFCLIAPVLLGVLAAAGVLAAQELPKRNTTRDSGLVLRQTVRRVRVDVVVTDAQGHPVTGLQASDFRVAEDGKPQSIRQFEYHSDDKTEAALPTRPPLPPHTFMNLPASPEHGPLTVLLYDILNTPLEDQLYAREVMIRFLKKNPGRRIAIFVLGNRLRFLQGFTSDIDSIERAINDPAISPKRSDISYSPGSGAEDMARLKDGTGADKTVDEMVAARKELEETEASARMDLRVDMTLDAFKQIGRFLSRTAGRKNLIWYSGSFPAAISPNGGRTHQFDGVRNYNDRIKAATDLLNTAEVAVYPIDAHGLQTNPSFSASGNTVLSDRSAPSATSSFFAEQAAGFATMDLIGEQTGGRAFYNINGLEQALETASAEGSSYYSLVYAPTNEKYDGSVRRIFVRIGQGRYQLAYRRSYIADDIASVAHAQSAADQSAASSDQAPVSIDSMAEGAQFGAPPSRQLVFAAHVDAIGEPGPATAEQIAALAPYREQAAKNASRKFVQPKTQVSMQQYAIAYAVLGNQLDLPMSANGAYHSDLSMAALAFDEDGETLWGTKTRLKDEIPASKIDSLRKDGFQAIQTFFVPSDTAVIRLVVRDEHSERVGSMEVRLPLPPDRQKGAGTH